MHLKSGQMEIKDTYLTVYNSVQATLWLIGLVITLVSFVNMRRLPLNAYFLVAQTLMLLDVLHVALRLVRGTILTTFLQIFSRVYMVWHVIRVQTETTIWNYALYAAWSLAEIIRYSYYLNKDLELLKFLRYNAFIVLYPVGVFMGEIPLIYLDYKTTGFKFSLVFLSAYFPAFPYLYWHMLKLRSHQIKKRVV
jgi:very-long-chain (3R)-3-hydroxyacyl-CoA dehydratase